MLAIHINFQKDKLAEDVKFVLKVAGHIGIDCRIVQVEDLFKNYLDTIKIENKLSFLHIRTRFINNIIFQIADNNFASVVDTTDKSERVTGRHAECFYGHFAPIVDLYKSELCDLVDLLGLPKEIKAREPGCPELLDIDAFGVEWKELDPVVYLLAEKKYSVDKISEEYKIDNEWLTKLKNRIDKQPCRTETKKLFIC